MKQCSSEPSWFEASLSESEIIQHLKVRFYSIFERNELRFHLLFLTKPLCQNKYEVICQDNDIVTTVLLSQHDEKTFHHKLLSEPGVSGEVPLTWGLSCVVCLGPCDRGLFAAGSPPLQPHPSLLSGRPLCPRRAQLSPARPCRARPCLPLSRTPSASWGCIPETAPGWGAEQAGTGPKTLRGALLTDGR